MKDIDELISDNKLYRFINSKIDLESITKDKCFFSILLHSGYLTPIDIKNHIYKIPNIEVKKRIYCTLVQIWSTRRMFG